MFRLFIPREAPPNGRPLCHDVRQLVHSLDERDVQSAWRSGKLVWSYERDYLQFVGMSRKVRIHLHSVNGVFMLVHVEEGEPDKIYRISRINDESFSLELEVLLKSTIGQLWGYRPIFEERERRCLDELRRRSRKV